MSIYSDASLIVTPNAYKSGKIYSLKPTDGSGDLSFTRATAATRVNSVGLIESVSSGIPRIDHSGGGCGKWLFEPQRTNLIKYSEQIDNAAWVKGGEVSITADSTTAPDGTSNADKATNSASAPSFGNASLYQFIASGVSGTYTASEFVKQGTNKYIKLVIASTVLGVNRRYGVIVDLSNGTLYQEINTASVLSNVSYKITNEGNGWYRISVTATVPASTDLYVVCDSTNSTSTSMDSISLDYTNPTAGYVYYWGMQCEAGSYATSYIPTTSATVTRNADQVSKTGISSLIGQTEGTIYIELKIRNSGASGNRIMSVLSAGTYDNSIYLYITSGNYLGCVIYKASVLQFLSESDKLLTVGEVYKIAVTYKANRVAIFVNGVQVVASSSALIPETSEIVVGSDMDSSSHLGEGINGFILFTAALTDAELIALTTL